MRIALAQINNTVGDLDANSAKILDLHAGPSRLARTWSSFRNWP